MGLPQYVSIFFRHRGCTYKTEHDLEMWKRTHLTGKTDLLSAKMLAFLFLIKVCIVHKERPHITQIEEILSVYIFQNGATHIYLGGSTKKGSVDASKDLLSLYNSRKFLVFKSGQEFKAEEHFGCRGRESNKTNMSKKHQPLYDLCSLSAVGIQAHPKVSLHLNNNNNTTIQKSIPVCDPHAPPVALPSGTYVQFDPHRALYSKQMFWALPFYIEQKIEPIWSVTVQKLMWLIGNRLVIHSPVWQQTVETKFDEHPVMNSILNFSQCEQTHFALCLRNMIKFLIDNTFLDKHFLEVSDEWTQCLTQLNYTFPALLSQQRLQSLAQLKYDFVAFQKLHQDFCMQNDAVLHPVDYTKIQIDSPTGLVPILNLDEINKIHLETCQNYQNTSYFKKVTLSHPWTQFPNILLLVVFNNPTYESIPVVETLYRPFFPHILYCGPGMPDLNIPTLQQLKLLQFSFCPYKPTPGVHLRGSFNYECVVNAINMHYHVEGILFVADDLLLAPSKIKDLQTNATWYVPVWDTINDDVRDPIVVQWGFYRYRPELMRLWDRIERDQNGSLILHECYNRLVSLNGDRYRLNGGFADLYYVPQRIAEEFSYLSSIFLEQNTFLEIAVPTIFQCLDGLANVQVLDGEYRNENGGAPWLKFVDPKFQRRSYLHRTKWSFMSIGNPQRPSYQDFFCTKALPWLHDPNGTLPS